MKFQKGDFCFTRDPSFKFNCGAHPLNALNIGKIIGVDASGYEIKWFNDQNESFHSWFYDRKRADIALLSINIYNKSIIRTLYGK